MEALLRYRGRAVTAADVHTIRELIAAHPTESRRGLSQRTMRGVGLAQSNGVPRDMVCRGLMLNYGGPGTLSCPRFGGGRRTPLSVRRRPQPIALDQTPLEGSLQDLPPLTLCPGPTNRAGKSSSTACCRAITIWLQPAGGGAAESSWCMPAPDPWPCLRGAPPRATWVPGIGSSAVSEHPPSEHRRHRLQHPLSDFNPGSRSSIWPPICSGA